jgi:RNA polymerase sigma-70 factor (ECF subfamily)
MVKTENGGQAALKDELATALAADLDGSFEGLVLAYQDRLYALALRLTNSPRDAEEIVQDAFVRAYRALGRAPTEQVQGLALAAWLYRITLNVFRNRVRGRRVQVVPLDPSPDGAYGTLVADVREQPEAQLARAEQRAQLAALLAALPERQRTAVTLRHVAGLGYEEMAAVLGQPVGTVKANVHRGLLALRAALVAQARDEMGR